MPLSESERNRLAVEYIAQYFPNATEGEIERIKAISVKHFSGDYSPIAEEQDSPHATGTGNTFEEYVLCTGINVTGIYPPEISEVDLHHIIVRNLM